MRTKPVGHGMLLILWLNAVKCLLNDSKKKYLSIAEDSPVIAPSINKEHKLVNHTTSLY